MFTCFVTAIAAAAGIFATASPEMTSVFFLEWLWCCINSLGLSGSVQSFYLNPSQMIMNHITVSALYLALTTLPTLFIVSALLSHRMHHSDKFLCLWSWIVALIVLGKHTSMVLLHPKIFTEIVLLSKLYLLVLCIVAPCFWFVSKLLRLVRKMVCASFKAAHASFMIPPPMKSHPLPLYVKSSNEDSPMSPLP